MARLCHVAFAFALRVREGLARKGLAREGALFEIAAITVVPLKPMQPRASEGSPK